MEGIIEYIKQHWITLFLILFLSIVSYYAVTEFLELSEKLAHQEFEKMDLRAAEIALEMRSDTMTIFLISITYLGNWHAFVSLFIIFTVVFYRHRKELKTPLITAGIIAGAGGVMYILKEVFARERPTLNTLVEASLPSFPSGHSMLSVVFYGFLIFYLWRVMRSKFLRVLLSILLVSLILLISWSRIYLGAHFASDVIAGIAAGVGWLSTSLLIYVLVKFLKTKEEELMEIEEP